MDGQQSKFRYTLILKKMICFAMNYNLVKKNPYILHFTFEYFPILLHVYGALLLKDFKTV